MHEASLIRSLLQQVLARASGAGAVRVVGLTVRLGALAHLSPEHFDEHFRQAARGTLAEGATIDAIIDTDLRADGAADIRLEAIEIE
ncbi:MAG: hydrogenase maturation nickel metallochaperone HypA [Chromatiales bacterium]|nr:hydrogenase maturation nickel metallochaperone HypA [Chromatiales bacterium]